MLRGPPRTAPVLQIRSSFLLKHMTRMEAFLDEEEGRPQFLEMWFQSSTFGSDTKTAMQLDRAALQEVMGTVYLFCKWVGGAWC